MRSVKWFHANIYSRKYIAGFLSSWPSLILQGFDAGYKTIYMYIYIYKELLADEGVCTMEVSFEWSNNLTN